ncbi:MAG: hydroxyacid dehydrogenase, partial [Chloroflexi bacterium]|nr:hydroxyacid dehydrogenase [Chloroflexota bacterium]
MSSLIVVHPDFDLVWPLAADHFRRLWEAQGEVRFVRLAHDERRPLGELTSDLESVERLVALSVPVTPGCARRMTALREAVIEEPYGDGSSSAARDT